MTKTVICRESPLKRSFQMGLNCTVTRCLLSARNLGTTSRSETFLLNFCTVVSEVKKEKIKDRIQTGVKLRQAGLRNLNKQQQEAASTALTESRTEFFLRGQQHPMRVRSSWTAKVGFNVISLIVQDENQASRQKWYENHRPGPK